MTDGVSVVICCYNSSERLPETLKHLLAQQDSDRIPWEVVLVDNGSTDGTQATAQHLWTSQSIASLNIVSESRQGLNFARDRGAWEAKYEFVCFVDDDNWVNSDWVANIFKIMTGDPSITACGGSTRAVFETTPADWFKKYEGHFAIGSQGNDTGEITDKRGRLWGAGLTIRRSSWLKLVKNGFRHLTADRQGTELCSGGDSELCYALSLAGGKLWYDPALKLDHYIPSARLTWSYARKLHRGFGSSSIHLDPYLYTLRRRPRPKPGRFSNIWTSKIRATIRRLTGLKTKLWCVGSPRFEGDSDVLEIEYLYGRLTGLLRLRGSYDRSICEIANAPWISKQWKNFSPENDVS